MPEAGYKKRTAAWSRDECIAAAERWRDEHGQPPAASDWNPSDCRSAARRSLARASHWLGRAARFDGGEYPWTGTIYKQFGGWNAFIAEAGFTPRTVDRVEPLPEVKAVTEVLAFAKLAIKADAGLSRRAALTQLAHVALELAEREPDD